MSRGRIRRKERIRRPLRNEKCLDFWLFESIITCMFLANFYTDIDFRLIKGSFLAHYLAHWLIFSPALLAHRLIIRLTFVSFFMLLIFCNLLQMFLGTKFRKERKWWKSCRKNYSKNCKEGKQRKLQKKATFSFF